MDVESSVKNFVAHEDGQLALMIGSGGHADDGQYVEGNLNSGNEYYSSSIKKWKESIEVVSH